MNYVMAFASGTVVVIAIWKLGQLIRNAVELMRLGLTASRELRQMARGMRDIQLELEICKADLLVAKRHNTAWEQQYRVTANELRRKSREETI